MNTTYSVVMFKFLPVGTTLLDIVEGTVVTRFAIPKAVVIISHNVNHIQILCYSSEIVSFICDRFESRDRSGEALPAA